MQIHKQKAIMIILVFATLFTTIFLPCSTAGSLTEELSASLLRFRVLANSDSEADLAQKNQISRQLVSVLSPALQKASDKSEAAAIAKESIPFLEAYAAYLTEQYGNPYQVHCSLGPHLFPCKSYENYQFPAGIYDTLLVTIGEGAGSNWWCLAFPPLCFADESFVSVPETSEEALSGLLSKEAYEEISTEKENTTITFGLFSLLKKLFF